MDISRWQNPDQWRTPARVAFGNMTEINPQDPAHQILLEGDAEVIPTEIRDANGRVTATAADAEIIVSGFAHLNAEFFAALKNTRLLVRPFVGYDDIDIDAATEHGVLVCNMADAIYEDVSNQTMALMLAVDRQMRVVDRWIREGNWARTGQRMP